MIADAFFVSPKPENVHECVRTRGDVLRFDPATQAYGVMDKNRVIRTYFKPIPCSEVPVGRRSAMRQAGRCHRFATNLDYFRSECKRW